MRNTMLVDMNSGSSVNCFESVAEDENTLNLVFYPRSTNYTTYVTVIDIEDEQHVYSFTGNDIYFLQIPLEFYSYGQQSIYLVFSDSNGYTSERIQIMFVGREDATEGEMYLTKIADVDYYTVFYKKTLTNTEVVEQLEENAEAIAATNEEVQNISNTVAQSATLNEALIESLTTNLTKYALKPRVTHRTDGWEWTDFVTNPDSTVTYTPCFSTTSTDKLRNYINIEDEKIKYVTEGLVVPSDYSKISESDTAYLTVNEKQVYYTDLSTLDSFTLISPRNFDSTITSHVEDMYKCRKLQTAVAADWNIEIFQSVTASTVGTETEINKTVGVKFDDVATVTYDSSTKTFEFTKISDIDTYKRGIKVLDNGCYYTNDGVNWYLIGGEPTAEIVKIIDHNPTEADFTGSYAVFAQYDAESTPVVDATAGKIFNATNVYVEIPIKETVTVDPATVSVVKGNTQTFTANVGVTWSVSGGTSGTSISSEGVLTVSATETATELTVTATSVAWPTDKGTATVTVIAGQSSLAELITEAMANYYEATTGTRPDYGGQTIPANDETNWINRINAKWPTATQIYFAAVQRSGFAAYCYIVASESYVEDGNYSNANAGSYIIGLTASSTQLRNVAGSGALDNNAANNTVIDRFIYYP